MNERPSMAILWFIYLLIFIYLFQPAWHTDLSLRFRPGGRRFFTTVSGSVDSLDINIAKPCDKYPSLGMDESCKYPVVKREVNLSPRSPPLPRIHLPFPEFTSFFPNSPLFSQIHLHCCMEYPMQCQWTQWNPPWVGSNWTHLVTLRDLATLGELKSPVGRFHT